MTNETNPVPPCPDCGERRWEFHEDWSGEIIWQIDATGWHEERRSGETDDAYWRITCLGCGAYWTQEEGEEEESRNLRDAIWGVPMSGASMAPIGGFVRNPEVM